MFFCLIHICPWKVPPSYAFKRTMRSSPAIVPGLKVDRISRTRAKQRFSVVENSTGLHHIIDVTANLY